MGKIYVNQTKVDLYVECKFDNPNVSMANVTSHKIKLVSPTGKVTMLDSVLEDDGVTLSYKVSSAETLNEKGVYTYYPYLVFDDERVAYGQPSTLTVYEIGE